MEKPISDLRLPPPNLQVPFSDPRLQILCEAFGEGFVEIGFGADEETAARAQKVRQAIIER